MAILFGAEIVPLLAKLAGIDTLLAKLAEILYSLA
jgi:hypothetical protein